jgi:hypothetical protein
VVALCADILADLYQDDARWEGPYTDSLPDNRRRGKR